MFFGNKKNDSLIENLTNEILELKKKLEEKAIQKLSDLPAHSLHTDPAVLDKKRQVIEAAIARAKARQQTPDTP